MCADVEWFVLSFVQREVFSRSVEVLIRMAVVLVPSFFWLLLLLILIFPVTVLCHSTGLAVDGGARS